MQVQIFLQKQYYLEAEIIKSKLFLLHTNPFYGVIKYLDFTHEIFTLYFTHAVLLVLYPPIKVED